MILCVSDHKWRAIQNHTAHFIAGHMIPVEVLYCKPSLPVKALKRVRLEENLVQYMTSDKAPFIKIFCIKKISVYQQILYRGINNLIDMH